MNESEVFIVLAARGLSLSAGLQFFRLLRCYRRFTATNRTRAGDTDAVNAAAILSETTQLVSVSEARCLGGSR